MPKKSVLSDAQLTVAAVIFQYAEQQYALPDVQSECVVKSLRKADGLRLDPTDSVLLRLAAILPIIASSLLPLEDWTPTEHHAFFSRELRRQTNVTSDEISLLKARMDSVHLDTPENLGEYVGIGYALQLGRLFGFAGAESNREDEFIEHVATALKAEEKLLIPTDGGTNPMRIPTVKQEGAATSALLVYQSAFRFYETFQRTSSKQVLPNDERAIEQATEKKIRQAKKAKAKLEAKRGRKGKRGRSAVEESGETSGGNSTDGEEGEETEDKEKGDVVLARYRPVRNANKRKRGYIDYVDEKEEGVE